MKPFQYEVSDGIRVSFWDDIMGSKQSIMHRYLESASCVIESMTQGENIR